MPHGCCVPGCKKRITSFIFPKDVILRYSDTVDAFKHRLKDLKLPP